ncbi:MAG: trigger factor [Nitrospiraceae bacterium]|nr:trigger factor [Nitrospiraceae bacterium]
MDVLIEPLEGAQRKFRVVFSDEDVRAKVEKEIQSTIKALKVPGYRVGHVPPSYIRSRAPFLASIHESVTEALRQSAIDALVNEDSGTVVFLDPEPFSVTGEHEKSGITVSGTLECFSLPGEFVCEGISLSPEPASTVTRDEIEKELESLSKRAGTQFKQDIPEDATIEEGDLVSFSFSFTHPDTGLPYENRQTINVGDPAHPEALTRSLIGRKVGESFSERLPFNIPAKKKGDRSRVETLDSQIRIESLKRIEPATREELLKALSSGQGEQPNQGTLEDLVEKRILERKVSEALTRKLEELVLEVLSRNSIDVPERRIALEIDRMVSSGMAANEIDKEQVRRDTLWWFILDDLSRKMEIQPDMGRVEQEYLALVRRSGNPEKDESRRREYVEQAFLSARRRLTEEILLKQSTFSGWDEFFGPEGLLEKLGWKSFGVRPEPHDTASHDHHDHDHDHEHDHDHGHHH